ncbi:MAG: RluA family pseudouridine synthase [Kiritimatiellaeota bacterium]|nr:RluA family pseudouridine synthase [Kiritimatiellota bacterium]
MRAVPGLTILYEDDLLVALDKPARLLIAPDRWDKSLDNLMQRVHTRLSPDIFNVHRLDKDTSGVVLCAKTKPALDRLLGQFAGRKVSKRYLAITLHIPAEDERTVDLNLAPDPRHAGRMRTHRDGQLAVTHFQTLEKFRGYALVSARPETGRQHQIRVHLAALRCPVLGDPFYGGGAGLLLSALKPHYKPPREGERPLIGRLALHAESLALPHPGTGELLTIRAPLPNDFAVALKYLRRFAA